MKCSHDSAHVYVYILLCCVVMRIDNMDRVLFADQFVVFEFSYSKLQSLPLVLNSRYFYHNWLKQNGYRNFICYWKVKDRGKIWFYESKRRRSLIRPIRGSHVNFFWNVDDTCNSPKLPRDIQTRGN